jgi:hypothetical protein
VHGPTLPSSGDSHYIRKSVIGARDSPLYVRFWHKADILTALTNVRFWHKADMLNALTNVRFEGKNGHDAGMTPFRLVTKSGHPQISRQVSPCRMTIAGTITADLTVHPADQTLKSDQ